MPAMGPAGPGRQPPRNPATVLRACGCRRPGRRRRGWATPEQPRRSVIPAAATLFNPIRIRRPGLQPSPLTRAPESRYLGGGGLSHTAGREIEHPRDLSPSTRPTGCEEEMRAGVQQAELAASRHLLIQEAIPLLRVRRQLREGVLVSEGGPVACTGPEPSWDPRRLHTLEWRMEPWRTHTPHSGATRLS